MGDPLFKVGERVGLVSKTFPERNGEYTVREVLPEGAGFTCRLTGRFLTRGGVGYGYMLEELAMNGGNTVHEKPYHESALRKLHKPSKYSFNELLSEIKSCNMNTIKA